MSQLFSYPIVKTAEMTVDPAIENMVSRDAKPPEHTAPPKKNGKAKPAPRFAARKKCAQFSDTSESLETAKRVLKDLATPEPAMRYDRALISQRKQDPTTAGVRRATYSGAMGAAMGAVLMRAITNSKQRVGVGAALGGAAGAGLGYVSGKNDAESENSRLLFLRRRLGINEPGELEMLLQNPQLTEDMITRKSAEFTKAALTPGQITALRGTAGALAGGLAGAGWGFNVSPEIGKYKDSPAAVGYSGMAGTGVGALVGLMAGLGKRPLTSKLMQDARKLVVSPRGIGGIAAGALSGEVLPQIVATMGRQSKSMDNMAGGMHALSVPDALDRYAGSNTAKGVIGGLGAAGLAAVGTGLTRRKSDEDIRRGRSRQRMIARDFIRYALPGALGGGVIGSLT